MMPITSWRAEIEQSIVALSLSASNVAEIIRNATGLAVDTKASGFCNGSQTASSMQSGSVSPSILDGLLIAPKVKEILGHSQIALTADLSGPIVQKAPVDRVGSLLAPQNPVVPSEVKLKLN